jgi:hypothetical protein
MSKVVLLNYPMMFIRNEFASVLHLGFENRIINFNLTHAISYLDHTHKYVPTRDCRSRMRGFRGIEIIPGNETDITGAKVESSAPLSASRHYL